MFGKNEAKEEVLEKKAEVEGAKEVEKSIRDEAERPELLDVKLNLMELSHRDVEKIEKYRYKLIANKGMKESKKLAEFKEFVFNCLLRKDEVSGINADR